MTYGFLEALATPGVHFDREANGIGGLWQGMTVDRPGDRFSEREAAFIAARDSFYIASNSQTLWPYIQDRGGPCGFLRVLNETTLGFADFLGNRQYLTLGHLADDDRVALFLIDYANRRRLKILAHMTARDLLAEPELADRLIVHGYDGIVERGFTLRLRAFDWNCSQHITPRITDTASAAMPHLCNQPGLQVECKRPPRWGTEASLDKA
jgi:uncharacterized protein